MPMQMWKGQVSEIVDNKQILQRLEDGWALKPSQKTTSKRYPKYKLEVKGVDVTKTDLTGPEDLNNEE